MLIGNDTLIAKEGYIYTNGDTFGYTIYLGIYDSPDNWWEITEEEHKALLELEENSTEATEEGTDGEATKADYIEALGRLGVK